jgi:hypothetical protein
MSGGTWGYQSWKLPEDTQAACNRIMAFSAAIAESEHLIDWAESGDSSRESTEPKLYDLWLKTFNEVFGEH